MPTLERLHKTVTLGDFKALETGAGGGSGYPSKFWELDDVGDIVCKGAYGDCIPDFLRDGFISHSHDWEASETIGYPTVAREDETGLYSEWEFHSTANAQDIRVKVDERKRAGKTVKLSIGYQVESEHTIWPDAYEMELPKYIPAEFLAKTLEKAKQFYCVRLLLKVKLFEYSIVTVPALQSADVLDVKALKDMLVDGVPFEGFSEAVADAADVFVRRTKARAEMRVKEGRKLSAATIDRMKTVHANLLEACDHIGGMLTEAEPAEKASPALLKERLRVEMRRAQARGIN